jgi:hypothetical protein
VWGKLAFTCLVVFLTYVGGCLGKDSKWFKAAPYSSRFTYGLLIVALIWVETWFLFFKWL